ncbi:HIRAN domain-containing protein [Actinokineospora guangxiensis]|uniref:HIRAN domain-containing protein n=1 Tax=Actinokineospora guangxiensis TaxID=1490288 RepID=A0ABW0EM68_9PSEU
MTSTNAVAEALFGARLVIDRRDVVAATLTDAAALRSGRLELVLADGARHRLRFSQAQQPGFADLAAVLRPGAVLLRGRGSYDQPVVGESHHFLQLRALCGAGTGERTTVAELRPEPDNPHDADAVRVLVEDQPVGYLPREAASAYQPALRQVGTALSRVRLWWSHDHGELGFIASASLDLADPAEALPLNEPETSPHVALPTGRSYELSTAYLENLTAVLAKAYYPGRALVYGSLHADGAEVSVRVDGREVGRLPENTSARFAPLVRRFADAGLTCYAEVALSGDAQQVEARLKVAAPESIPGP